VRRERPRPGAQLNAFEEADGRRYTAFAADTRIGQLARLDARHRAHGRVEDRIRCAKDAGMDHFPSHSFAIDQTWLSVVMLAVDLIAWDPAPAAFRRSREGRAEDVAFPGSITSGGARAAGGGDLPRPGRAAADACCWAS